MIKKAISNLDSKLPLGLLKNTMTYLGSKLATSAYFCDSPDSTMNLILSQNEAGTGLGDNSIDITNFGH